MQLSHSPRHHVAKPRPGKLLALTRVTLATITLLSGFSLPTDVRAADPPQTDAAEVTANSAAFEITINSADATVAPDPVLQRQLSVAPSHQAMLPADRPAWVGAAPDVSTTQHRLFVGSFPTAFVEQVDEQLDDPMVAALNAYLNEHVLPKAQAEQLQISPSFIRHNLLDTQTEYLAELSTTTGPLYQKWVILEITPQQREHFLSLHRQSEQRRRMTTLGLVTLSVFGCTLLANLVLRAKPVFRSHPR